MFFLWATKKASLDWLLGLLGPGRGCWPSWLNSLSGLGLRRRYLGGMGAGWLSYSPLKGPFFPSHGLGMDYLWITYGLSMDLLW